MADDHKAERNPYGAAEQRPCEQRLAEFQKWIAAFVGS